MTSLQDARIKEFENVVRKRGGNAVADSEKSNSPVPQVRARSLYIQARNTRSSGANLGFAIFRQKQP
jgi:hypothetical protein